MIATETIQDTRMIIDLVKEYGWFVFPLRPNTRLPYKDFSWTKLSSNNLEQIRAWIKKYPKCNWGLDCGKSGILVVDIDVKKNKKGFETVLTLEDQGFELPATFTVTTTTKGEHLHYTGEARNSVEKLGAGVDTRGTGGYVVAPGSSINGNFYKITDNSAPAKLPKWVKDKVGVKNERPGLVRDSAHHTDRGDSNSRRRDNMDGISDNAQRDDSTSGGSLVDLDHPDYIIDAVKYLRKTKPSVEGEGGDDNAYKVACRTRDFGVSSDTALSLMLDFWNDKCDPPWEFSDLRDKVKNAYSYAENPSDSSASKMFFNSPVDIEITTKAPIIRVGDAFSELIKTTPPPREWIIKDWLPLGAASFFTGEGGVGKSLMAMQLAASVAHGAPWFNLAIETPMPVIMVMCEDSQDEIHRRAFSIGALPEYSFALEDSRGSHEARFLSRLGKKSSLGIAKEHRVKRGPFHSELLKIIQKVGDGPKLLVLDTITDVFRGNENDRSTVNQFVKEILGELIVEYNCTLLSIGHPPKTGAEYSGSTAWSNAHRNRLFARFHENAGLADYRVLSRSKSNYAARGEEINIQYINGAYTFVDQGEIHDDVETEKLEIIFEAVAEFSSQGTPLGMHHQAVLFLKDTELKDSVGKIIEWDEKKRLVNRLKTQNRIEEIRGQSRMNGLHPKNSETKEGNDTKRIV